MFDGASTLDEVRPEKPEREAGTTIRWYRPRIAKEDLARLNQRSDFKGFVQCLGYLATLFIPGCLFVWACFNSPWLAVPFLFAEGICAAFLINAFHELVHDSVFKTRWLNSFFLHIYSFLGWYNHISFWASHTEHHKYTLHQPDDCEVTLPQTLSARWLLTAGIVDWRGMIWGPQGTLKVARGGFVHGWEEYLFTKIKPGMRPQFQRWAWIVLGGHSLIAAVSLATGYWPVIIAVSFARYFGCGIQVLCNMTQHIGLTDSYPDFRVCCRTFTLNPVLRFLYWQMNYHTEHHMYAGVPCYNLAKLHALIRHELPPSTHGLVQTWRQINGILARQAREPGYQYFPEIPPPVTTHENNS
jgi:fatty acid desaturase